MRRIVFLILRFTGVPYLLRVFVQRNKVTILCYHDPAPEIMDSHVQALEKRYNIISLKQYIDYRKGRSSDVLPPRSLILTFDDGHKNNYRLKPVQLRHGIPVTIFLCSSIVGTNRHYWWTSASMHGDIAKLKRLPDEERLAELSAMGYQETKEFEDRQALSYEEIEDLKPLVDFQSHGKFHPIFPQCKSDRVVEEIHGSKAELEDRYGLSIYAIAYPNGDYSDRDCQITCDAGYECALTLDGGFNSTNMDLYRLNRIPIDDYDGKNELVVKASGLWDFLYERFRGRSYGHTPSADEFG